MTRLKGMIKQLKKWDGKHHRYHGRSTKREAKMIIRLVEMRFRTLNRYD